jgi:hypothetical protein
MNIMLVNEKMIDYLSKIQAKIKSPSEPIMRKEMEIIDEDDLELAKIVDSQPLSYCSECDEIITRTNDRDHHVLQDRDGKIIVAICCEGYHQIQI